MAEKFPPEIWIIIFKYLNPTDLCFSISPVNRWFFEISQDNQIWLNFKCDSWDETSISLFPTIKRKFATSAPSLLGLYKRLYIHWIREEGKKSQQNNDLPVWLTTDKDKKTINLLINGDIALHQYPLVEPLIQNYIKNKNPLFLDDNPVPQSQNKLKKLKFWVKNPVPQSQNKKKRAMFWVRDLRERYSDVVAFNGGMLMPFSDETKTITLTATEPNLYSRMPGNVYYLGDFELSKSQNGIFWCINSFSETQKSYIEHLKKELNENSPYLNHLMILDYSNMEPETEFSGKKISDAEKEWIKAIGAEYVEPKDIGTALEKMIKILERDYKKILPKYLPTLAEFERFVFKPIKVL